jgi:hypothetical protein
MSVYELDISWATSANERRSLHWQLIACGRVAGAFLTAKNDVLAVLFKGDRHAFNEWARTLEPGWVLR